MLCLCGQEVQVSMCLCFVSVGRRCRCLCVYALSLWAGGAGVYVSVLCLCGQEVQVIFVDYGNAEKVSISNVRCLTQEVAEIPAQAVGCAMFALKPFDVSVLSFLSPLQNNSSQTGRLKTNEQFTDMEIKYK